MLCGTHKNYGTCVHWVLTASTGATVPALLGAASTSLFTTGGNVTSDGALKILAPAGGVGQFRGLTQDATADTYVEVICKGIVPIFIGSVFPKTLHTTSSDNGFIVTCYTGASQCANSVLTYTATTITDLSDTAAAACMLDPRYLTWRAMTVKFDWNGNTADWWRTDSYWNEASSSFASTWGTGLVMGPHFWTNTDNFVSTGTNLGRTFVFAYGDGSGV
jgi:hypothetical protein